jgi:hypothetical protein
MTLPNETVLTGAEHPGTELQILESAGGHYLGFLDREGAPYSRETDYMTKADAEIMLSWIRSTGINGIGLDAVPV